MLVDSVEPSFAPLSCLFFSCWFLFARRVRSVQTQQIIDPVPTKDWLEVIPVIHLRLATASTDLGRDFHSKNSTRVMQTDTMCGSKEGRVRIRKECTNFHRKSVKTQAKRIFISIYQY